MGKKIKMEPGMKYGRWTIISESEKRNKGGDVYYNCICDCGTTRAVSGALLRNGQSTSCGCYNHEIIKKENPDYKTKLYGIHASMKRRCCCENEKSYANYGGRGIKVCEEWLNDFQAFKQWALASGYVRGLTLDRIDNDGDYCPENCRWVTHKVQNNNTRRNVLVEIDGVTKTLTEWAESSGIKTMTLKRRMELGWNGRDLLKPVNKKNSHPDAIKKGMARKREITIERMAADEF